jgi:rfaE bifunctional protein kinase chain/domain
VRALPQLEPPASLLPLLESFAGRRVLVVGDIVADHYIYGETDRISREAPVLIVRYEKSEVRLGGAGNAAANLRDLGASVTALGVIGRDEMGGQVRAHCRKRGIRLVSPKAPGLVTETKTRILAGGLNTRRQQMLRLDRGAQGPLCDEVQAQLAALLEELAGEADAVLVSDYGGGVLGEKVIAASLKAARSKAPVCVDSRYNLRAFAGATLLKPNEPEFEALAGIRPENDAELMRTIRRTRKRVPSKAMVMTRGRNGMVLAEGAAITVIPPHGSRPAVDVTGAGDTVGATLTLALAAGASFEDAARLANVAGALKVQKMGTVTVGLAELRGELEDPQE